MTQAIISAGFNGVQFEEITKNNEPWIRGAQVEQALGYTRENAVKQLYDRHADEFTDSMSAVVTLPTPGGPQETRIFSLRGCHLLAMFARTPVAKAFRVWVLDVLETLNRAAREHPAPALDTTSRLSRRTDPERKELTAMINAWVGCAPIHYAGARSMINAHFGVKGVDEMTVEQVKAAIVFVQGKIDAQPKALSEPEKKALPSAKLKALPAAPQPSYRERCAAITAQMLSLRGQIFTISQEMMFVFRDPFFGMPGVIPEDKKPFADAMNYAVQSFFMTVNKDIEAAELLFKAYVEGEKILNVG